MLRDCAEVLGADRKAALCRELTKKFEEVISGTLQEIGDVCAARSLKGEMVVLIERKSSENIRESDIDLMLKEALKDKSVRDAADEVSARTGLARRQVYQMALKLEQGE